MCCDAVRAGGGTAAGGATSAADKTAAAVTQTATAAAGQLQTTAAPGLTDCLTV